MSFDVITIYCCYRKTDQDPHPYQLWERIQPNVVSQFQEEIYDEDAEAIKQLPLETVVKRSLLHPIQTQYVNC